MALTFSGVAPSGLTCSATVSAALRRRLGLVRLRVSSKICCILASCSGVTSSSKLPCTAPTGSNGTLSGANSSGSEAELGSGFEAGLGSGAGTGVAVALGLRRVVLVLGLVVRRFGAGATSGVNTSSEFDSTCSAPTSCSVAPLDLSERTIRSWPTTPELPVTLALLVVL